MAVEVSLILISFNSEDRIAQAIESMEEAISEIDAQILVVDNASNDDSVRIAENSLTRGTVIPSDTNLGYGQAANLGLSRATGKYAIILNDDVVISTSTIRALTAVLDSSPSVGLAGPMIVDLDGAPMPAARMAFPGLSEEFARIVDIALRRSSQVAYPSGELAQDVAWLVGACIAARTDLLRRVGGFNPAFFLYGEDIDLARRVRSDGLRVVTVPSASCIHMGSVSTSAAFDDAERARRRAAGRDIYYRIWLSRPHRILTHMRRAVGLHNQPRRALYHLRKAGWDGPSLKSLRRLPPIR